MKRPGPYFHVIEFNTVFFVYQLLIVFERRGNRRFENHLSSRHRRTAPRGCQSTPYRPTGILSRAKEGCLVLNLD